MGDARAQRLAEACERDPVLKKLGVTSTDRYRAFLLHNHPDKLTGSNEFTGVIFQLVSEAFNRAKQAVASGGGAGVRAGKATPAPPRPAPRPAGAVPTVRLPRKANQCNYPLPGSWTGYCSHRVDPGTRYCFFHKDGTNTKAFLPTNFTDQELFGNFPAVTTRFSKMCKAEVKATERPMWGMGRSVDRQWCKNNAVAGTDYCRVHTKEPFTVTIVVKGTTNSTKWKYPSKQAFYEDANSNFKAARAVLKLGPEIPVEVTW
jgi:hypothetical protein